MIRPARPEDVPTMLAFVHELAEYEREPEAVTSTEADLEAALFGPEPKVWAHVAEEDGELVGQAVWYLTYSTWTGRHGIWLDDLYVRPRHRGKGYGVALLRTLAEVCVERGYQRFEWWVLDWNLPSIELYRAIGATAMDEWTVQRLGGDALRRLGSSEPGR